MAFTKTDQGDEQGLPFLVLCSVMFDWEDDDLPRTLADDQKDLRGTSDSNDQEDNGPDTLPYCAFSTGHIVLHEIHHILLHDNTYSSDVPLWEPVTYQKVKGSQEMTYDEKREF